MDSVRSETSTCQFVPTNLGKAIKNVKTHAYVQNEQGALYFCHYLEGWLKFVGLRAGGGDQLQSACVPHTRL